MQNSVTSGIYLGSSVTGYSRVGSLNRATLTTVCFQEPVAIMYTARLAESMVLKPRVTALGGTRS